MALMSAPARLSWHTRELSGSWSTTVHSGLRIHLGKHRYALVRERNGALYARRINDPKNYRFIKPKLIIVSKELVTGVLEAILYHEGKMNDTLLPLYKEALKAPPVLHAFSALPIM
jgi:hypothetical protein